MNWENPNQNITAISQSVAHFARPSNPSFLSPLNGYSNYGINSMNLDKHVDHLPFVPTTQPVPLPSSNFPPIDVPCDESSLDSSEISWTIKERIKESGRSQISLGDDSVPHSQSHGFQRNLTELFDENNSGIWEDHDYYSSALFDGSFVGRI